MIDVPIVYTKKEKHPNSTLKKTFRIDIYPEGVLGQIYGTPSSSLYRIIRNIRHNNKPERSQGIYRNIQFVTQYECNEIHINTGSKHVPMLLPPKEQKSK